MVGFELGSILFNSDGWGLPDSYVVVPNQISNAPFAPFSRSDKLGRIANWIRSISNRPGSNSKQNPIDFAFDFSGDDSFTLVADEDSSFRLVDTAAKSYHHGQHRSKFNPRWRFHPHHNRSQLPQRRDEEVEAKKHPVLTFSKLSFSIPEPEDLLICGGLEFYDRLTRDCWLRKESRPRRRRRWWWSEAFWICRDKWMELLRKLVNLFHLSRCGVYMDMTWRSTHIFIHLRANLTSLLTERIYLISKFDGGQCCSIKHS
ncbi:hypothetical protein RND71_018421 [Anisodus tanguticus]|uniref:Uncharacterized protein n=1 Tax=Anisodus tanguticus TaxID=243964 RepID=A0AAE1S468_9SOLA|nr:hypothetical protein RND71_018421 [Anisodus tanguticus]